MAAKNGGTRRAPAAAVKVAAGAAVSPADMQETLIPEPAAVVVEAPVLVEDATSTVEVLAAVADAVADGAEAKEPETTPTEGAPEPVVNRLAALAKLTGAPEPLGDAPAVVVPEVEASGDEQTWADGDDELVTGVVAFTVYQAIVGGHLQHAYKGETIHATEAVIARGEALGAVVRAD